MEGIGVPFPGLRRGSRQYPLRARAQRLLGGAPASGYPRRPGLPLPVQAPSRSPAETEARGLHLGCRETQLWPNDPGVRGHRSLSSPRHFERRPSALLGGEPPRPVLRGRGVPLSRGGESPRRRPRGGRADLRHRHRASRARHPGAARIQRLRRRGRASHRAIDRARRQRHALQVHGRQHARPGSLRRAPRRPHRDEP